LSGLRVQYSTADTAPFITNEGAELAVGTEEALAKIPLGLKVEGADYPVLRVFSSWPGKTELQRSLKKHKSGSDIDNHPLATLNLATCRAHDAKLGEAWFRGDGRVVPSKHAREEQGSGSGLQKKKKEAKRIHR
jgi:hypothetical protein